MQSLVISMGQAATADLAQPDVILASDTLYNLRSLGAFITTLNDLSTPDTRIFVANRHRVPAAKDLQLQLLGSAFEMEASPPLSRSCSALSPNTPSRVSDVVIAIASDSPPPALADGAIIRSSLCNRS